MWVFMKKSYLKTFCEYALALQAKKIKVLNIMKLLMHISWRKKEKHWYPRKGMEPTVGSYEKIIPKNILWIRI